MATHYRWYQYGILDLFLLTAMVAVVMKLYVPGHSVTHYEPLAEGIRPGQTWSGNGLDMQFRWCPAGEFRIGNDKDSMEVSLTRGRWFGTHQVTQAEWKRVMGSEPWARFGERLREVFPLGDQPPARFVMRDEAIWFCEKLTREERAAGRLPYPWKYQLEGQGVHGAIGVLAILPAAKELEVTRKITIDVAAPERDRLMVLLAERDRLLEGPAHHSNCVMTSTSNEPRWIIFSGFRLGLVQDELGESDQTDQTSK